MSESFVKSPNIEKTFLLNTSNLEKSPQKHKWVTVKDKDTVRTILETLGDDGKKKILSTASKPCVIHTILDVCDLPQTSGYRKIKELVEYGMLYSFTDTTEGKKANKYVSVFDNIRIIIIKNRVTIKVQFAENYLNKMPLESLNVIQKNPDVRQSMS